MSSSSNTSSDNNNNNKRTSPNNNNKTENLRKKVKYTSYPKPEAEYHEIIEKPDFFLLKLLSFHLFYGVTLRTPTIGGNQLDLHRLFLEVTSRGGIEKVIRDRKWKEVKEAFNFPSTITSGSFVLRKYYLSLLYHFEQVYYFRKEEPSFAAADEASRAASGVPLPNGVDDGSGSDHPAAVDASHNPEDGGLVTGTLDGKFNDGYLITVKLGAEEFKGVLYHTLEEPQAPENDDISPVIVHHVRRTPDEREAVPRRGRDTGRPKRNRSGYTFFFAEQYHKLRPSYHGQERAISKCIGHLWSRLTEDEKQVYQEKGFLDKERYRVEMMNYKAAPSSSVDPQ